MVGITLSVALACSPVAPPARVVTGSLPVGATSDSRTSRTTVPAAFGVNSSAWAAAADISAAPAARTKVNLLIFITIPFYCGRAA